MHFQCGKWFVQDLEAEIYAHVLEHHQAAVAGVADAIRDRKKQADGLERRAMAVISKPLAWYVLHPPADDVSVLAPADGELRTAGSEGPSILSVKHCSALPASSRTAV